MINNLVSKELLVGLQFGNRPFTQVVFKDTYYFVIYGIIREFTDKGQFHYLTKLKGPQVGNYLYTTQFLLRR